jgi:hypothetical protein
MSGRPIALAALALLAATAAQAGPLGSSAADAAYSARQLQQAGVTANGLYWFDFDGAGGAAAVQTRADMTTDGGGWTLVRHIAGTGGWINVADGLRGTQSLNAELASTKDSASSSWSLNYAGLVSKTGSFLFSAGNGSAWGELDFFSVFAPNDSLTEKHAKVLASSGVGVEAGGYTNVLNRSGFSEDPWIGFQGDHEANINRMMYGEAGWTLGNDEHSIFKNANGGINVWVREAETPPLAAPIPEPESYAMMLAGLGLLGVAARRRKQKSVA